MLASASSDTTSASTVLTVSLMRLDQPGVSPRGGLLSSFPAARTARVLAWPWLTLAETALKVRAAEDAGIRAKRDSMAAAGQTRNKVSHKGPPRLR